VDIDDSPAEAAFRAEARVWLEANAIPRGAPDDFADGFFEGMDDEELMKRSAAWQRTLWEGGWAGISYPREWYGRGGNVMQEVIFAQESSAFGVTTGAFMVAHTMVGPAILDLGTDEQRHRYLPAMLRGDEMWCQLFSEPGAGSDLAGLQTRARRDGDQFVVNGQKVWTSNADTAHFGILLARTDADAPKHRGITYFLLDMSTPGIDIRPLRQMTGDAHFSEVFLTDVVIPVANVLGGGAGIGKGWPAAIHTLANERAMIGGNSLMVDLEDLVALARDREVIDDPLVRQRLAATHTRSELLTYLGYRSRTALAQGRPPGPESSVMKLFMADHLARSGSLAKALEGPAGMLDGGVLDGPGSAPGDEHAAAAQKARLRTWRFLHAPSIGIAGGTDQVQRGIIAERVLGLPRDPMPGPH
jgi:alkylation response protein AidB-like acyl-CoA dehydrogenase